MTRLGRALRQQVRRALSAPSRRRTGSRPARRSTGPAAAYTPSADGHPDPGEVVWAWVPYEEDPKQGKDRPVLLVGRDGEALLGLSMTSRDHDLDAEDEARHGRYWMDVGSGAWDSQRRPSEVRLDRLLRFAEHEVRREGAALDRAMFDAVIARAREFHTL